MALARNRLRAGQNLVVFDVPSLFSAPLMELSEGDMIIIPRKDDHVTLDGRTWIVDHVRHEFVNEKKNLQDAVRQKVRVILREL